MSWNNKLLSFILPRKPESIFKCWLVVSCLVLGTTIRNVGREHWYWIVDAAALAMCVFESIEAYHNWRKGDSQ